MAVTRYSKRSIWIHWFSAILIFANVPTGLAMSETVASESKLLLYQIHFVIVSLVFVLATFHVYIKGRYPRPCKNVKLRN